MRRRGGPRWSLAQRAGLAASLALAGLVIALTIAGLVSLSHPPPPPSQVRYDGRIYLCSVADNPAVFGRSPAAVVRECAS